MNLIIAPINPNDPGPDITNLQDGLLMLLENGRLPINPAEQPAFAERLRDEQRVQRYGDVTQRLVSLFQAQYQPAGDGLVDDLTAEALNQALQELGAFGQPAGTTPIDYHVEGKVASRTSAGVGGLRVVIVDKGVGGDVPLTQVTTDQGGAYRAVFSDVDVQYRGKAQLDLQARVFAGDTFLGASEVRYNASPHEILNVLLDTAAAVGLPSEHEVLTGALSRQFAGQLGDLKETGEQQDITYLANKTGWDARAVALAALADQFSARTMDASGAPAVPPAYFYALFRAGLPANEDTLYHTDSATLTEVWHRAMVQGIISAASADQIPRLVEQFQGLSAQRLLAAPALVGTSSLREMLDVSRLDEAQQETFAQLYAANRADTAAFWQAAGDAFGTDTAVRLQVDGKLGFLTLNNASLMHKVHTIAGADGLSDPLQLAQMGYHRAEAWSRLLDDDVPLPQEIPGDTPESKRANYVGYLAAQVRLSYPTAAVAQMVKSGELPLPGAANGVSDQVHAFLTDHQGSFEIGVQPVEQYLAHNNLQADAETIQQVKRLQRAYQITPSDQALIGLMGHGIDAAYHVVRYDKDTFVQSFAADMGGEGQAALTYERSVHIHNAVLNIALSYMNARTTPAIGVHSPPSVLDPTPANAGDVIAYATLESLFDTMDFCDCEHCRSLLSPAAYLVDLLLFLRSDDDVWAGFLQVWKTKHANAPYPFANQKAWQDFQTNWSVEHPMEPLPDTEISPFDVLVSRRPDIEHLPLTCENTNTALPYIDVVNETLEYFIANNTQKLSLRDYQGHDTNGAASEDLLASPQYVMESAYATLRSEVFPGPLPFHQPLENLRRLFTQFEVPLALALERFRQTDDLERGMNAYGWRDIWMEELGLSRAEYEILTDSGAVPLWEMAGFSSGTSDADVIAGLSNAKQFARRVEITYDDLVSVLRTRFVNPNSNLIPKLERLGVSFAGLKALKDGTMTGPDFDKLLANLAVPPDPAQYGGDIKVWVKDDDNYTRIMGIITLADPTGSSDLCSFDDLEFRYSEPMTNANDISTRLSAVEFARLLRFLRLWNKLGWTIEQTDAALCALYRADLAPLDAGDIDSVAKLDTGFLVLLPRLGLIVRLMRVLNLTVKRDLLPLLACWSEVGPLYHQMFLNPALLEQDAVFADNGYGEFLVDTTQKLAAHADAMRSGFNLSGDEYDLIVAALGYDANTVLTMPTISAIYRRGWLARKLKLSVRELLLLVRLTGLDPFDAPDLTHPAIVRLIELVQSMKARSLKSAAALYLIWNQDLSGKSTPELAQMAAFARTLRLGLAAVESEFAVTDDPDGAIAQARMAMVYGADTAAFFFGLLNNTLVVEVEFNDLDGTLLAEVTRQAIEAAAGQTDTGIPKIAYDDFRKRLSYSGVLTLGTRDAIKLAAGGGVLAFKTAVDDLCDESQAVIGPFFARYPELQPAYDAYVADTTDTAAQKRSNLLAAILPELIERRKRQQALQATSTAANTTLAFTQGFLDPTGSSFPLHAAGHNDQPALNDLLSLETAGLSAQFYASNTATGPVIPAPGIAPWLDYAPLNGGVGNPLPANPSPGAPISGIWDGYLEAPESGFFKLRIEADAGASVTLLLDGKPVALAQNGTLWSNVASIQLRAGTLYAVTLMVEKVRDIMQVAWEWQPKGQGRTIIPARYLYPAAPFEAFARTYVRFLKVASLAAGLGLTTNELAHFATHADYHLSGDGWLNALPVSGDAPNPELLLHPFEALLGFARIKVDISPGDESLLAVIEDPQTATQYSDSLLFLITRWNPTSLNDVLTRFSNSVAGLEHFELFRLVYDAFALIQTMGISAKALIEAATNEPVADNVRSLQAALRARYDAASWREVVRPLNDDMRSLQRDALVAYILHQMRSHPETTHIDTADKLFEYFLMDVQMDPCMQTSRIRHALSSVQLFIERCLMALEPRVSPSAINAGQWIWMKRYRVWEANRKVYLFPENWLEPELRDDKSPFFKEIESELLQSDITDDSAATALLNYLSKLEEVAKLEPCGIFHIPRDDSANTSEINHVIARSAGASRKYYYRRYEYGYWTPWEPIKLDVEDNPVMPVVWNDRLLLFWLRVLKNGPDKAQKPAAGKDITQMQTSEIPSDPKMDVRAMLCWSEYTNGKWQATKTSDIDDPTLLDTLLPGAFKRSTLYLGVKVEGDALRLYLREPSATKLEGQADWNNPNTVKWFYVKSWPGSFLLYNTHSLPVRGDEPIYMPGPELALASPKRDFAGDYQSSLAFKYTDLKNKSLTRNILEPVMPFRMVSPRHELADPWTVPFFLEDRRHVFYVTTRYEPVWVSDWQKYGVGDAIQAPSNVSKLPPLVLKPEVEVKPKPWGDGGPIGPDAGIIDPAPMELFVTEDAYIHQGLGSTGVVTYGDQQIGPSGAINKLKSQM